ncbi:MAG: hypothetical protein PHD15_04945 [Clostridia bacterium]|nr:hypothetical protein [Clostridia bacterium]MDD4387087.1 hypothetical protein [Clostridia bacterium]
MKSMTKLKRMLANRRFEKLFKIGLKKNKISYFEFEIFEKLKGYQYGGCPLNVLIGSRRLSDGKCYDRSMTLTFIFNDCVLVNGDLSRYAKTRGDEKFDHSWVEVGNFVYDTTWGMKFDKKIYYKLMGVKINKKQTTAQMMQNEWYVEQKQSKLEDNLSFIDITAPLFIAILETELKEYERQENKYYIELTISLIQYSRELLEMPEVKELVRKKEEFLKNMEMVV